MLCKQKQTASRIQPRAVRIAGQGITKHPSSWALIGPATMASGSFPYSWARSALLLRYSERIARVRWVFHPRRDEKQLQNPGGYRITAAQISMWRVSTPVEVSASGGQHLPWSMQKLKWGLAEPGSL